MNMLGLLSKMYSEQNISHKYFKNLEVGHCDGCTWHLKQINHTLVQFPKRIKAWTVAPGCSSSRKPPKQQWPTVFPRVTCQGPKKIVGARSLMHTFSTICILTTSQSLIFQKYNSYIRSLESREILSGSHDSVGESPLHFYVSSLCVIHSTLILSQFSFVCFFHPVSDRVNFAT